MGLPAIPAVISGAIWGYRALKVYRAARAAQAAAAAVATANRAKQAADLARAAAAARALSQATSRDRPCEDCPCERTVAISSAMSPLAAQHIADAQTAGHPSILTLDRAGVSARRTAALRGIPTIPGMDRDEYPPATFLEGGAGASVRHVPRSDNRSAGGQLRAQLRGVPEGCKITVIVGP